MLCCWIIIADASKHKLNVKGVLKQLSIALPKGSGICLRQIWKKSPHKFVVCINRVIFVRLEKVLPE